jgi:hypothetical protein
MYRQPENRYGLPSIEALEQLSPPELLFANGEDLLDELAELFARRLVVVHYRLGHAAGYQ